ncbi:MAG: domain S-box [Acidobacteria bacterium]|nr:domain S-box [Acidobacteriota bacterium]
MQNDKWKTEYPLPENLTELSSQAFELAAAQATLENLASVFFPTSLANGRNPLFDTQKSQEQSELDLPGVEAIYRTLVEQIPAVVFMAVLDKGIGEAYVSPQIEELLGFSQAEWLNDPVRWYHQIHPDDKDRWSGDAARLFLSGDSLRSVYRVMARDGHAVSFHCEAKMVRRDDGRPWFIHGVAFDISDLKRAEEAQQKSEEMLRGLFEFAPDTIVVVNQQGKIARANTQVETMFGYTRTELIGETIETLLPERFRGRHIDDRSTYIAEPHTRPMGAGLKLYGRRKNGSEFPVDIMLSPMKWDDGGMVIAVIRDITRRSQAEESLSDYADRLKFLSRRLMEVQETERRNIARELHDEIGQALTGLKLTLEMGARLPADGARASLEQAQVLVNELMARARRLSLDLRPAMLDDLGLVPTLLWHIEHYTAQTRVRVHFRHSGLETRRFSAEVETAAYRIVQEALTNVARHARVVEATVRLWTHEALLSIQVEDCGSGFDSEAALASSDTSGLAGMRERAVLLGGQLTVESAPGDGTRLTAELSIADSPVANSGEILREEQPG